MLKLCENGSNIDYLYETSSVLRKATETKISGLNVCVMCVSAGVQLTVTRVLMTRGTCTTHLNLMKVANQLCQILVH